MFQGDSVLPQEVLMQCDNRSFALAFGLAAFLFTPAGSSNALAQFKRSISCAETAALHAAASQAYAARHPKDRLTICHIATDDKDCTETVTLPAAAAAGHLAQHKATKRMIDTYRPCAFEEFSARAGLTLQIEQCPN